MIRVVRVVRVVKVVGVVSGWKEEISGNSCRSPPPRCQNGRVRSPPFLSPGTLKKESCSLEESLLEKRILLSGGEPPRKKNPEGGETPLLPKGLLFGGKPF